MAKDTRIFRCSCGNVLHINFVTRKITVMGREGERAGDLDEMVADLEKEAAGRDRKFERALEEGAKEKQRLEDLFEQAKKKVSEEKGDEKPPSIFDLD